MRFFVTLISVICNNYLINHLLNLNFKFFTKTKFIIYDKENFFFIDVYYFSSFILLTFIICHIIKILKFSNLHPNGYIHLFKQIFFKSIIFQFFFSFKIANYFLFEIQVGSKKLGFCNINTVNIIFRIVLILISFIYQF